MEPPPNDVRVRVRSRDPHGDSGPPHSRLTILVAIVGVVGTCSGAVLAARATDKVAAANRTAARETTDLTELRRVADRGALQLQQAIGAATDLRDRCQEAIEQRVIAVAVPDMSAPEFGKWQRAAQRLRTRLEPLSLTEVQLSIRLGVDEPETAHFTRAKKALVEGSAQCRNGVESPYLTPQAAQIATRGITAAKAKQRLYLDAARSRVGSRVPVQTTQH